MEGNQQQQQQFGTEESIYYTIPYTVAEPEGKESHKSCFMDLQAGWLEETKAESEETSG